MEMDREENEPTNKGIWQGRYQGVSEVLLAFHQDTRFFCRKNCESNFGLKFFNNHAEFKIWAWNLRPKRRILSIHLG